MDPRPLPPAVAGHRLAKQSLLWTIIGVLSATVLGVIALFVSNEGGAQAPNGDHEDLGSPVAEEAEYEGLLAIVHQIKETDAGPRCAFTGFDFDTSPQVEEQQVTDDNDFSYAIDLQGSVCGRENAAVEATVAIRPDNEGGLGHANAVGTAKECLETAEAKDLERNWSIWDEPSIGYKAPDLGAFCLLSESKLIRVVFQTFEVYRYESDDSIGDAFIEMSVTVWPLTSD